MNIIYRFWLAWDLLFTLGTCLLPSCSPSWWLYLTCIKLQTTEEPPLWFGFLEGSHQWSSWNQKRYLQTIHHWGGVDEPGDVRVQNATDEHLLQIKSLTLILLASICLRIMRTLWRVHEFQAIPPTPTHWNIWSYHVDKAIWSRGKTRRQSVGAGRCLGGLLSL